MTNKIINFKNVTLEDRLGDLEMELFRANDLFALRAERYQNLIEHDAPLIIKADALALIRKSTEELQKIYEEYIFLKDISK